MEHGIEPPDLSQSFADRAGNNIAVQKQLDVTPVEPPTFNNTSFVVGQPSPDQPSINSNNNTINTPNPVSDGITNVGLNIEAVSPNTPSILGDIFSAGDNLFNNVAEVGQHLSGGQSQQLNNTTQPVQQITAAIDDAPQMKVNDSVTGFQNNFSTPNIA